MKKIIQYVIVVFLLYIAFLSTSERFVYHLSTFEQSFGEITFEYITRDIDNLEISIKHELLSDLKMNNFDVYKVETKYVSDYYMVKTIYGTPNALEYLRSLGIKPDLYTSFFIGDVEIKFSTIQELDDIYSTDVFRFIGTYEDAVTFKNILPSEISSLYQVIDIKAASGSENDINLTIYSIWGGVFAFILLISFYNVILSRKETIIKLTLGINPWNTFIKSSLMDIIVYSFLFYGLSYFLEFLIYVKYKFNTICILFVIMLILNTLINATINNISFKKDITNDKSNNGALIATYTVKCISLVMTIIVLSANSVIITQAMAYFEQENFFENKSDYNYYRFYYSISNVSNKISEEQDYERIDLLWKDFDKEFNDDSICIFDMTETFETPTILLNSNAVQQLGYCKNKEFLNTLSKTEKNKIYIFFPDHSEHTLKNFSQYIYSLFLRGQKDIEIIGGYYKGDTNLVSVNKTTNIYRSTVLKQPIVILDTVETSYTERYLNPKYFGENILYITNNEQFNMFVMQHSLIDKDITITNSKELYYHNYLGFKRNIKLIFIVSLLICLLEIIMIVFLLNLEYISHGVELAIKKTLGYTIISRNIRIFLVPIIIIPICTIVSYIIINTLNLGNPIFTILIGALLLIFEMLFVVYRSIKIECKNISTVLKGEQS